MVVLTCYSVKDLGAKLFASGTVKLQSSEVLLKTLEPQV